MKLPMVLEQKLGRKHVDSPRPTEKQNLDSIKETFEFFLVQSNNVGKN